VTLPPMARRLLERQRGDSGARHATAATDNPDPGVSGAGLAVGESVIKC
jgi:hypothetical protein